VESVVMRCVCHPGGLRRIALVGFRRSERTSYQMARFSRRWL